jgi:hypothetical protein
MKRKKVKKSARVVLNTPTRQYLENLSPEEGLNGIKRERFQGRKNAVLLSVP